MRLDVYISVYSDTADMPTLILYIKVMEISQMSSACFPSHLFTTISQMKRGAQPPGCSRLGAAPVSGAQCHDIFEPAGNCFCTLTVKY